MGRWRVLRESEIGWRSAKLAPSLLRARELKFAKSIFEMQEFILGKNEQKIKVSSLGGVDVSRDTEVGGKRFSVARWPPLD